MLTLTNATYRCAFALLLASAGCGGGSGATDPDGSVTADAEPDGPDAGPGAPDAAGPNADAAPGDCPTDATGLACVLDLYDQVAAGCDPDLLAALDAALTARHGDLPLWYQGRALFVTRGEAAAVAGEFDDWSTSALLTSQLCGSELYLADTTIASGFYQYKLVRGDSWLLDPENWAFAYDDYEGNPDGKNSVLDTYDSGRGHLVQPDQELCSTELGNCRPFTTYLPPGYGAPAQASRRYPVVFMHDGQNIYDDHDCCFGHTGWEVNVQLDADIAAGEVEPAIVVGFDHAGDLRGDEYAYPIAMDGEQETFMAFQVEQVQPTAATYWRLDPDRVYTAGSSFGGLVALTLAFTYPDVYAGAASLSGAFWPGQDENLAMRDTIAAKGKVAVALYLDHGGSADSGGDGYFDNLEVRDLLVDAGWSLQTSPDCTAGDDALCYYHAVDATHDELAWRDRSFRFLRYFFATGG